MNASDFMKFKNWVVIGDVTNETKYAHKILSRLQNANYSAIGVTNKGDSPSTFKSLSEINTSIDVVDLCINPIKGLEYIKEAHSLGIKHVLIQPGAESNDIINYCNENNITAIEGCALVELNKLQ